MRVQNALERFLLQLEADGRSPNTISQYRRHVHLLSAWLRQQEHAETIESVTSEDVAKFIASPAVRKTARGSIRKPGSANAIRGSIKGFFRWLLEAGLLQQDPSRLLRRALTAPAPPRGLRPAEEERLLKVLRVAVGPESERDRVLVELMLRTGIRLSSALGLDVEDVDQDEGVLLLRRVKGGRTEQVFMGSEIRGLLSDYLRGRGSGPVFAGSGGRRITARHAQRRFRSWRKEAGIPESVSPHSLRHSFALQLYQRTGDILLVQKALGHRSITSTLEYAHADEGRLRSAMEVHHGVG